MDEQRAEFEAWAKSKGAPKDGWWIRQIDDGGYSCHAVDMAWGAWQATTQRQQERITELEAQVQALTLETERTARNRDMWKGQTRRQADRLHDLHTCMAAIKRLLARDPCAHANTAIQMIDAAIAAGKGDA